MDELLNTAIEFITNSIGSDPEGWDKPMSAEDTEIFMSLDNSDRSAETVSFA